MLQQRVVMVLAFGLAACVWTSPAAAVTLRIQNVGPTGSLFLTPFWVGIHDGTFDIYDQGAAASGFGGLEELAEDGATGPLSGRFAAEQVAGGIDTTVVATGTAPPPFNPQEAATISLNVASPEVNRYFSYASMIVPSNDAFIANGNPLAHHIFDTAGNFLGPLTIEIFGRDVNDAGTELNAETDVAFLSGPNGQSGPNQGADENGVVGRHLGLNGSVGNPAGAPMNILGGTTAAGTTVDPTLGDFTRSGGDVLLARITILPEPSGLLLAITVATLAGGLGQRRRR